jgi:hypothetical protein
VIDGNATREAEALRLARDGLQRAETANAANDIAGATRWFERCHRLLPQDHYIALQLALVNLGRDNAQAEALFGTVAEAHDLHDAWLGLVWAWATQQAPRPP